MAAEILSFGEILGAEPVAIEEVLARGMIIMSGWRWRGWSRSVL